MKSYGDGDWDGDILFWVFDDFVFFDEEDGFVFVAVAVVALAVVAVTVSVVAVAAEVALNISVNVSHISSVIILQLLMTSWFVCI